MFIDIALQADSKHRDKWYLFCAVFLAL